MLKRDYKGLGKMDSGPGGWHCPCCNSYGTSARKMKPLARRRLRRVSKQRLSCTKD
jgi:hypothetical protein